MKQKFDDAVKQYGIMGFVFFTATNADENLVTYSDRMFID